jgi:hypothetical protein
MPALTCVDVLRCRTCVQQGTCVQSCGAGRLRLKRLLLPHATGFNRSLTLLLPHGTRRRRAGDWRPRVGACSVCEAARGASGAARQRVRQTNSAWVPSTALRGSGSGG